MAEGTDPVSDAVAGFLSTVGSMLTAMFGVFWKIISFCFWILSAIFILPCVFVAGTLYPLWTEWGEDF